MTAAALSLFEKAKVNESDCIRLNKRSLVKRSHSYQGAMEDFRVGGGHQKAHRYYSGLVQILFLFFMVVILNVGNYGFSAI